MKRSLRQGFTLIELLVVIAVIALLIGILLPALGKARSQGQSAQCQGHLKQYATAHQIYITDHGCLPGLGKGDAGGGDGNRWNTEVGLFYSDAAPVEPGQIKLMNGFFDKYLGDAEVFSCPADPKIRYTDTGSEDDWGGRYGNFLMPDEDERSAGATFTRVWFNPAGSGGSGDDRPPDYYDLKKKVFVTIGGITEARSLLFMYPDRLISPSESADIVEEDEVSRIDNSLFVPGEHAYVPHPADPGTSNRIAIRHPAGSGNIAYHDGHVTNIANMMQKYWTEEEYARRVQILWWQFRELVEDEEDPGP